MFQSAKSIRAFIGAKDFEESKRFYTDLGFQEISIDPKMSYIEVNDQMGFYLQDYYAKDWINNSMIFLEVEDLETLEQKLLRKELHEKYPNVRFTEMKIFPWGKVFFVHDPSGILWQIGQFNEPTKPISKNI